MSVWRIILGVLVSLVPGDRSRASDSRQLLEQAGAAFEAGRAQPPGSSEARSEFERAAELYSVLYRRGYAGPELMNNIGNAYLLAGDVPRAVLAYHRGLRHAPANANLLASLEYARTLADPSGTAPSKWTAWWRLRGATVLGISAALLYAMAWCGVTAWWVARRARWLVLGAAAGCVLAIFLPGVWRWHEDTRRPARRPWVVVAADRVDLRLGDGVLYPARPERLYRGAEATLITSRGAWAQIETTGGVIGWVPLRDVLVESENKEGEAAEHVRDANRL